jgi:hypothetical protein
MYIFPPSFLGCGLKDAAATKGRFSCATRALRPTQGQFTFSSLCKSAAEGALIAPSNFSSEFRQPRGLINFPFYPLTPQMHYSSIAHVTFFRGRRREIECTTRGKNATTHTYKTSRARYRPMVLCVTRSPSRISLMG